MEGVHGAASELSGMRAKASGDGSMQAAYTAFTDGACRGNPGPGGWGVLVAQEAGRRAWQLRGGDPNATNNRMELMAAIQALEFLPEGEAVRIHSDSRYVQQGITSWIRRWRKNGWRSASGARVLNQELWERLDAACARRQVDWRWVKGHAGVEGNEAADRLAREGLKLAAARGRAVREVEETGGGNPANDSGKPADRAPEDVQPNEARPPHYMGWMLSLGLAHSSEAAAVAASDLVGRGDERAADQAAVEAMRRELNRLDIAGRVVIGEGERDEAPMLFIGENVGNPDGVPVDIALDPLEGTTLCAKSLPNSMSVIAMGPRNTLLHAPDVYMNKIAVGPGVPEDAIDLDAAPADNLRSVAAAKGVSPTDVSVCVLERPRHREIVEQLRDVGASVRFITDGDVAAVMHAAQSEETGIDLYMGVGGAPEGVLAAAALRCMGGHFQGRLLFRSEVEAERARRLGIDDLDRKYTLRDLVAADVIFAATGVTDGSLLRGARRSGRMVAVETLLLNSHTGSSRRIRSRIRGME